ncbi:MAG: hypothetical protein GX102_00225 [Porphyromonadaceae bacterium]|jgi:hypothetical protein|nr:hypothetical protein [Porphyromonadaceae bacterium]
MLKRFLKISLLGLFLFYYAGSVFFIHSHLIDGVTIVHSHPFPLSKSSHTHTSDELITIGVITHTAFLLTLSLFLLSKINYILSVLKPPILNRGYKTNLPYIRGLRAPPLLVF